MVMIAVYAMPITYIACLFVAFLKCVPFNHQWQINPNPGSKFRRMRSYNASGECVSGRPYSHDLCADNCMPAVSVLQTIFVMIMNTITDIYLMMIPIPVSLTHAHDQFYQCLRLNEHGY